MSLRHHRVECECDTCYRQWLRIGYTEEQISAQAKAWVGPAMRHIYERDMRNAKKGKVKT